MSDKHCFTNSWRGVGQEGLLHRQRISSGQTSVYFIFSLLDRWQIIVGDTFHTWNIFLRFTDSKRQQVRCPILSAMSPVDRHQIIVGQKFCTCTIYLRLTDRIFKMVRRFTLRRFTFLKYCKGKAPACRKPKNANLQSQLVVGEETDKCILCFPTNIIIN